MSLPFQKAILLKVPIFDAKKFQQMRLTFKLSSLTKQVQSLCFLHKLQYVLCCAGNVIFKTWCRGVGKIMNQIE